MVETGVVGFMWIGILISIVVLFLNALLFIIMPSGIAYLIGESYDDSGECGKGLITTSWIYNLFMGIMGALTLITNGIFLIVKSILLWIDGVLNVSIGMIIDKIFVFGKWSFVIILVLCTIYVNGYIFKKVEMSKAGYALGSIFFILFGFCIFSLPELFSKIFWFI